MALVDSDYTLKEALGLIAKKFPDKEAMEVLFEALVLEYPRSPLKAWIINNRDGSRSHISSNDWGSTRSQNPTLWYDEKTSQGKKRVDRRVTGPPIVSGEIRIDREHLDELLAKADSPRPETDNTSEAERPEPGRGRKPSSEQRAAEVNALFDAMHEGDQLTFERGELTRIGKEIGKQVGLQGNSVEREIRLMYRQLKQKHRSD